MILRFLDYVEKERGCQARTRNTRLAALRAFMRYVAQHAPEALALASQVQPFPSCETLRGGPRLVTLGTTASADSCRPPTAITGRRSHRCRWVRTAGLPE